MARRFLRGGFSRRLQSRLYLSVRCILRQKRGSELHFPEEQGVLFLSRTLLKTNGQKNHQEEHRERHQKKKIRSLFRFSSPGLRLRFLRQGRKGYGERKGFQKFYGKSGRYFRKREEARFYFPQEENRFVLLIRYILQEACPSLSECSAHPLNIPGRDWDFRLWKHGFLR